MRRNQIIQLLQFILARIIVRILVVFVSEKSFIDFILQYRLYLLIVSVSYRYYYSIEYEPDKKYEFIRKSLIYGNLYLFAHIFFRPLLNISHELFIALWLTILWLRWTTKIKSKRKIFLQILWCIISFFILISWIFYLYPESPDIEWFIKSQTYKLTISGITNNIDKNDAFIKIQTNKKSEEIQIIPWYSREITDSCTISYPSLQENRNEKITFSTPQWDIFILLPQSSIELNFTDKNLVKVSNINWKIWFLSWLFNSTFEYEWWIDNLDEQQINTITDFQNQYKSELISHLKLQISDSSIDFANNTIMYNLDGKLLKILAKLFPATFSRNLENYNDFQKYFSIIPNNQVNINQHFKRNESTIHTDTLWSDIKENAQVGKQNIYAQKDF